jgi:hypothetical protein
MAEQLSLNVVLHRSQQYRILDSEMNWHCHCSDVAREGAQVRIRPSARIPAIVHLSDLKSLHRAEQYRNNGLFYEKPEKAGPPESLPNVRLAQSGLGHRQSDLRICVYTCLIGSTEMLNEQPIVARSKIPFICFTDTPDLTSKTWQLRPISRLFEMDTIRSHRAVKLCPHEYLTDFDVSLYIDNSVLLDSPPEELIGRHFPESGLALPEHSFRNTVMEEFLAVANYGLDDPGRIFEQLNHYTLCDSEVLQEKPYWGGILLRDHRNPAVRSMLDLWLAHVLRYSRRDQLSMNFVLRRTGLKPNVLSIDNHNSGYHTWPRKTPAYQQMRIFDPVTAYGSLGARVRELEMKLEFEKHQSEQRLTRIRELEAQLKGE